MSTPAPEGTHNPPAPPPAPVAPPPPSPRKATCLLWLGGLLVLAVLAVPLISWWFYRRDHSITEDAFVEAHIVNIAPQTVSGHIVRFLVAENDHVVQGQLLAEIDPVPYRDQVEQAQGKRELAEAEKKRQQAGLTKLKKDVPLQIDISKETLAGAHTEVARAKESLKLISDDVAKTIDEAHAAVAVAKANLTLAKQEYDRFTDLAKQDAITERKAQEVTRSYDAAKAETRLADAKLAKAEAGRTRIEVARHDLAAAGILVAKAGKSLDLAATGFDQIREGELTVAVKKETVKDAQIGLDSARHQLRFTQVRAPFPGVVVKCYRHLGDFASPGVSILSMYNPDLLYVTANLPETRLRGVAPGNSVELHLNAFAEPFHGRVVWINKSTGAEFSLMPRNVVSGEFTWVVQRVPVRIAIEKDERWPQLRAGLSVRAVISHGPGDPAWAEQAAREMAEREARYNRAKE